jgi:hypothetical protein
LPAPGQEEDAEEGEEAEKAKKAGEKGLLGGGLLAEIRKAAKKSLFSLILAGGLVLYLPAPGQAEALVLGTPQTPMVGVEKPAALAKGPDFARADFGRKDPGLRPLGHFSGEPRWESSPESPAESGPGAGPGHLATRAHCRSLNRVIDLSFLGLEGNGAGQAEARALSALARQARKWGLEPGAWVRLVKAAYDRDKTVYITDLDGDDAPLILARPYFPKMGNVLKRRDFKEVLGRYLLPHLDGLPKSSAEFWDRLFMDFYQRLADPEEAALSVSWHLARRSSLRLRLEYGGQLGAFPDPGPEKAAPIFADYVMSNWPAIFSRGKTGPEGALASRLAADLCAASHVFGAPWAFMAVVAQRERERGAPWPSTMEVYGAVRVLARQIERASLKWSERKPAICDLDLLAQSWYGDAFGDLLKKKKSLAEHCARGLKKSESLFA